MLRILFAAFCAVFLLFTAASGRANTIYDERTWLNLTSMGSIYGDFVYLAEINPRFRNGSSRLDQLILRGALGVKLNPNLTLYQGYARIIMPVDRGGPDVLEDRISQQLSWTVRDVLGGEFQSRTRFEQRLQTSGNDMGFRLRELLRYEHPIGFWGWNALVSSELFLALNKTDWGATSGFDQVRNFVGFEIPIGGASTIEAGYLNQLVDQSSTRSRMNHVMSLTLFYRH